VSTPTRPANRRRTAHCPAPARLGALALAVALAACGRDLELPSPPAGPRLDSLHPASAYGGQLIEVRGTGFAEDPTANQVDFPRATTRGLGRTPAGLLVRVPASAGSGSITVTTSRGLSQPLPGFGYRGLGQLLAGQVIQSAPLLHRPQALLAPGSDPVIDSTLYRGLVGALRLAAGRPAPGERGWCHLFRR